MKIKLLAVLLTFGLLGFGMNVSAVEEKKVNEGGLWCPDSEQEALTDWGTAVNLFCTAINVPKVSDTYKAACKDLCDEARNLPGTIPSRASVKKCGEASNTSNSQIAKGAVKALLAATCGKLCQSNFTCKSCKMEKARNICGEFCCNFTGGEGYLGACLTDYKENCKKYQ